MRVGQIKLEYTRNPYHFILPNHVEVNDQVVIKTSYGQDIGCVQKISEDVTNQNGIIHIERKMNKHDEFTIHQNVEKENEIKRYIDDNIDTLQLNMKLIQTHISFDQSYLLVEYESEQRVDFRELVKLISNTFHIRTEMKQIGPRDIARVKGGIGPCGLILCCTSFIGEFESISIKMAKNQSLSLNPQNISGLCGKLLCCIKYEDETYNYLKMNMPAYGSIFKSEHGEGKVIDINYISQKVKIKHTDGNIGWYDLKNN
jgi:cell fate regulator YaaT (PSP1 superfamily)